MIDTNYICVVGSSHIDMIIYTERIPKLGETVLGKTYQKGFGGKGANQAIVISRLGAPVKFISKIGNDKSGKSVLKNLKKNNIATENIFISKKNKTGSALIMINSIGQRSILVAQGANADLDIEDIDASIEILKNSKILLTQLEIPVSTIEYCFKFTKRFGIINILNASPAFKLSDDLLKLVDIIIINQIEAEIITGRMASHIEAATKAGQYLIERGVNNVIITMDNTGVLLVSKNLTKHFPYYRVKIKDKSGASSAFSGALAVALYKGSTLPAAIEYANAVSALTISKYGIQKTFPTAEKVEEFIKDNQTNKESSIITTKNKTVQELYKIANEIRKDVIQMLAIAKSGHPGGSLSAIEILTTLYFSVMTYNPKEPRWENRDRFILSKGHGAPAYYAVLARAGFFEREQLWTLRKINSKLQGHPDMNKTPGVDMTTGSLGQGLSAANGMAMIGKLFKKNYKVYVLLGDGEVEEGEIWEAAMTANHYKLDNLIAIIDYNGLQIDGSVFQVKSTIEPLADKWISFGWYVITVNGHDIEELLLAFKKANEIIDRPKMIIAYTIKGKGISFMERVVDYHGSVLSESECQKALEELKYI